MSDADKVEYYFSGVALGAILVAALWFMHARWRRAIRRAKAVDSETVAPRMADSGGADPALHSVPTAV